MDVNEICLLWGELQVQRWWSCMTKAEWSGWMQAFGSVAAILFAVYISSRDRSHAKELHAAAEKSAERKERELASALVTRFCGGFRGILEELSLEVDGYLWDYQRIRVLLGSELELIKIIPLNSMNHEERYLIFNIHMVALQVFEALINAEKHANPNAEGRLVSEENSRLLVWNIAQSNYKDIERDSEKLERLWRENDVKNFL